MICILTLLWSVMRVCSIEETFCAKKKIMAIFLDKGKPASTTTRW